jgi:hypothetical protein
MLCHRIGAKHVILTDNDEISINHMKLDCPLNAIDATVLSLDWFNFNIEEFNIINCDNRVLLVAGDVLYKKILIEPFFAVVKSLFVKFGSKIEMILCHVPRADVKHCDVIEAMGFHGLHHKIIDPSEWKKDFCVELSPKDDNDRASVYHIYPINTLDEQS